jgi:hypothetical protein
MHPKHADGHMLGIIYVTPAMLTTYVLRGTCWQQLMALCSPAMTCPSQAYRSAMQQLSTLPVWSSCHENCCMASSCFKAAEQEVLNRIAMGETPIRQPPTAHTWFDEAFFFCVIYHVAPNSILR